MLEHIRAIAELEPSGIIHIAVFFSFHKLYKFYLFDGVLLLGRQPFVQKRLFSGKLQNQYKFIFTRNFNLFFFFCFILQEHPMIHFLYMHLKIIAAHKYLHKKQKTITYNSRNRENKKCPNLTVTLPIRYRDRASLRT